MLGAFWNLDDSGEKRLMPQQQLLTPQVPRPQLTDIEAWLEAHQKVIFICPRLPGRPRITKETCQRRMSLAKEINDRSGNESLFDGGGPVGLDTCLGCPVGVKACATADA